MHGLVRPDFEHDPDARRLWEVRRFASCENLDIENRDSAPVPDILGEAGCVLIGAFLF